jgi:hypothetical protein
MQDVNTIVQKAYYNALLTVGYPYYEGEEPDSVTDKEYIVLTFVNSSDISTKNSTDVNISVELALHTWDTKYNSSLTVNEVANAVLQALKPNPDSVLDLTADGCQMINLKLINDRTERVGELSGRKYVDRFLTFTQQIFIFT